MSTHKGDNYYIQQKPGNRTLVVFVHGLGGTFTSDYWSNLPAFLKNESFESAIDTCFWGYKSSKSLFANMLSILRNGKKMAEIERVAGALHDFLLEHRFQSQYSRILIAGHSLGGLVALRVLCVIEQECSNLPIAGICLMSSPITKNPCATWVRAGAGHNPHIRLLSDKKLDLLVGKATDAAIPLGVKLCYLSTILDEVVEVYSREHLANFYGFSVLEAEANHSWPSQITNRTNPAYRKVVQWLSNSL